MSCRGFKFTQAQQINHGVLSHRSMEVESLQTIAACCLEPGQLGGCFYAFRDDLETEAVGECKHGADDGRIARINQHINDEAVIDLDAVKWQLAQMLEG